MVNGIRTIYLPQGINKGFGSIPYRFPNSEEGPIGRNVVNISIKMETIVQIL